MGRCKSCRQTWHGVARVELSLQQRNGLFEGFAMVTLPTALTTR